MNPIIKFLQSDPELIPQDGEFDFQVNKINISNEVEKLNKLFQSVVYHRKNQEIIGSKIEILGKNQVWKVKNSYIDFNGNYNSFPHPIIVFTTGEIFQFKKEKFIRALMISPFIEMADPFNDYIIEDLDILGFPFFIQISNSFPISVKLFDKFIQQISLDERKFNDYTDEKNSANYLLSFLKKIETNDKSKTDLVNLDLKNLIVLCKKIIDGLNKTEISDLISMDANRLNFQGYPENGLVIKIVKEGKKTLVGKELIYLAKELQEVLNEIEMYNNKKPQRNLNFNFKVENEIFKNKSDFHEISPNYISYEDKLKFNELEAQKTWFIYNFTNDIINK